MKDLIKKFELWWLWVPVLIVTAPQLPKDHPNVVSGAAYSTLFALALMGVFFRPRTPKVIYSHLNSMLRRVMWLMSTFTITFVWGVVGIAVLKVNVADWVIGMGIFAMSIVMGVTLTYLIYWSLPYSRKRSGIAAVDAAIERYRKPGEIVQSQWMPDMIVDEERYRVAAYFKDPHSDPVVLGFTHDGQVVREEMVMDKVLRCMKLAGKIMHPQSINERANGYKETQKALRLGHRALQKWQTLFDKFDVQYVSDVEWLRRGLEMWMEYGEGVCRYWYLEAEYGMQHGNTRMREVRYEDVERLNRQVDVFQRVVERVDEWQAVWRAARRLNDLFYRQPLLRTAERKALVDMMLLFQDGMRPALLLREENVLLVPYIGMTNEIRKNWQERLAWVDLVDSWVAQGYTGKALEAKKREYLLEQARREAEQKQQEEAEKARKREERKMRRKAKAVKSTEVGGKNGTL